MQQMMRSMELVPFLFIIGFLLVVAGIIIFAGLHARRRASLIKATPTSNIGMAEDGYCEFEGTIEAIDGRTLIAPLTKTQCAWYHARLEKWERRTSGDTSSTWHTIRESTSDSPILLRDTTGVCLVLPAMAEVTPTDKSRWTGGSEVPTDRNPPRLGPTESTTKMVEVSGGPNSRFRYSEERIYVGDPLLVLGEFATRRFDPDEDDSDDDLEDDAIDSGDEDDEADEGGAHGADDWDNSALEDDLAARAEQITRACIQRGSGKRPFIVTTTPQATHVYMSDMGGQAALYVALGPLGLIALLLYARFN